MQCQKADTRPLKPSLLILNPDQAWSCWLSFRYRVTGHEVDVEYEAAPALRRLRRQAYDIVLLDQHLARELLAELRTFDTWSFVILTSGQKEDPVAFRALLSLDVEGLYARDEPIKFLDHLIERCSMMIQKIWQNRCYQEGLQYILSVMPQLQCLQPYDELVRKILTQVAYMAETPDVFVYLRPQVVLTEPVHEAFAEEIYLGCGSLDFDLQRFRLELQPRLEGAWSKVWADCQRTRVGDLTLLPLTKTQQKTGGMIGFRYAGPVPETLLSLLDLYARQAATALSNMSLHLMLNSQRERLEQNYRATQQSYRQTIEAMRLLVDAKDIYTRGHSDRVSYLALKLAERVTGESSFLERVKVAGLLHDIGKIGISDSILCKQGRLSEAEFELIRQHPLTGAVILEQVTMFSELGPIICAHHERYDGGGYPHGLAGEDIPLEARIITVADAFDAMMSHRHYRRSLELEVAIAELVKGKGTQFDAELADLFLDLLVDYQAIRAELAWTLEAEE